MRTRTLVFAVARAALAVLLLKSAVQTPAVLAQAPSIVTYSDFVKFDVLKADVSRAGFVVQIQLDASTGTWFAVPAATLGTPTVLPDTAADSVTYQVPIAPSTPAGVHTLYVRFCVGTEVSPGVINGITCGPHASGQFDLRTTAPPPTTLPPAAPGNLRFGPKGGGL